MNEDRIGSEELRLMVRKPVRRGKVWLWAMAGGRSKYSAPPFDRLRADRTRGVL